MRSGKTIELEFPYLVIYSETLANITSKLLGVKVMGGAVPPCFIFFRDRNHPMHDQWLVHEKTHHRQDWETLYLIQLFRVFWYASARLKGMSKREAYINQPAEQEAYANQHNPDYLKTRRPYAFLKYIRNKPVADVTSDSQVVFK